MCVEICVYKKEEGERESVIKRVLCTKERERAKLEKQKNVRRNNSVGSNDNEKEKRRGK